MALTRRGDVTDNTAIAAAGRARFDHESTPMFKSVISFRRPRASAVASLSGSFLLCLALAGCSVYHAETEGGFSTENLTAQGTGAGIPIQVDGAVGGVRGAELAKAVIAQMPAEVDGTPVRYAPCDSFSECAGDHVVWTFGPPAARPASAYPPARAINVHWFGDYEPAANNVAIQVALFQGPSVVASASGQVNVDNPGDEDFQSVIAEMSRAVLRGPGWFNLPPL